MELPRLEVLEAISEIESESPPFNKEEKALEASIYGLLRRKGRPAKDAWVVAKAAVFQCRAVMKRLGLKHKSQSPTIN
jgi:hypothetical protein